MISVELNTFWNFFVTFSKLYDQVMDLLLQDAGKLSLLNFTSEMETNVTKKLFYPISLVLFFMKVTNQKYKDAGESERIT